MDAFSNMDEAQGQPRYRSWALQGLLCLLLGACGPSAEGPSEPGPVDPPKPTDAKPLARVGPHRLGLDEVREAVAEARALVDEVTATLTARFWEEEHGLYADEASADFAVRDRYRGQNANMHGW